MNNFYGIKESQLKELYKKILYFDCMEKTGRLCDRHIDSAYDCMSEFIIKKGLPKEEWENYTLDNYINDSFYDFVKYNFWQINLSEK